MRRLALIVGLVILTAGLAGCADDEGEDVDPQSIEANNTTPTLEQPNVTFENEDEVYVYEAESTSESRWVNDSFSPASCFACPGGEHRIDVTDMLPRDAPALLQAQVNDSHQFSSVSLDIQSEGAHIYDENGTFQETTAILAAHGGTVEVVVQNGFPDADTEIAYELQIHVTANRTVFPAQVPIAFPPPENPAGLVVEPLELEGEQPRLMLWDGEDNFLGHHAIDERTTINVSEAVRGEMVGYLTGAEGVAHLAPVNASETDTTMRPLPMVWNEAADSVSSGEVQVAAQPNAVPMQAGLFLEGDNNAGTDYSGELAAGNGTLLSFDSSGYVNLFGVRYSWLTDMGAPELGPGEYVGTFEFSQSTGGEAGVTWLTYER